MCSGPVGIGVRTIPLEAVSVAHDVGEAEATHVLLAEGTPTRVRSGRGGCRWGGGGSGRAKRWCAS